MPAFAGAEQQSDVAATDLRFLLAGRGNERIADLDGFLIHGVGVQIADAEESGGLAAPTGILTGRSTAPALKTAS
jgi:hypothetical protein